MNRTRLLMLTLRVSILLRLMLSADALLCIATQLGRPISSRAVPLHQALIARLMHHHTNAYARRKALRDHLQHIDPRGSLGDEFLGVVLILGLAFIAPDIFADVHRAYAEHLAQAFSSLAMATH